MGSGLSGIREVLLSEAVVDGNGKAGKPINCLRVVGLRRCVDVRRSGGRVRRVDLRSGSVTAAGASGLKIGLSRVAEMVMGAGPGVTTGETSLETGNTVGVTSAGSGILVGVTDGVLRTGDVESDSSSEEEESESVVGMTSCSSEVFGAWAEEVNKESGKTEVRSSNSPLDDNTAVGDSGLQRS